MKHLRFSLIVLALMLIAPMAKADKGMYLISMIKQENMDRMRELGLKLNANDLYSQDGTSLSSAVAAFDNGCTSITVSDQGLLFTNHHCGYRSIQSQSSVEHDYLKNGFVAGNKSEELPIPNLTVMYLREFVDVTDQVLASVAGIDDEMKRMQAIQMAASMIEAKYEGDPHTAVAVYPFYEHNAYYLVIYDVFTDVRLVFAPPVSMGKFGGDTDNWMWPRHTNDFSVFRVYAGKDNKPADYSADNKPYKPRHYAKVSTIGVKEGDYAMTIGFPGSTDRYLSSWGVVNRMENENAPRILVRGLKQGVWTKYMESDPAIRIQYANKYASSSNYWKNSIGMNKGLRALDVVKNKQEIERKFSEWVAADEARTEKYGFVLDSLRIPLEARGKIMKNFTILSEALSGTEFRAFSAMPSEDLKAFDADALYKDFNPIVGKAVLPVMLKVTKERVDPAYLPSIFATIDKDFGGDYEKFAEYVYDNSVVLHKDRMVQALKNYEMLKAAHETDPAVQVMKSYSEQINILRGKLMKTGAMYQKGRRLFMAGLQEMSDEYLPSDANFTMRLSYGNVGGYKPYDGAWYDYYTTQQGIFEKENPQSSEFAVQPELLKKFKNKEFGEFADRDGNLHLCFISNNDITGGNSGSPVFNGDGNLIGLAFDGNWEAMSGDIEFEPNLQRTISVDIRYVLWAIKYWGKADYLVDELTLVK
ncbi:S46 family peptidase [Porphyromonas levii]|uniref:S46 family peptidase n=1 Tax=Porphyromonas levii TaxID=28114 RepID=UPI001BAA7FE3|nr:S46 family peptidase [Porphyromonas levii]